MGEALGRNGIWLAARGMVLAIFGAALLVNPLLTLDQMAWLFAGTASAGGLLSLRGASRKIPAELRLWPLTLEGCAGLSAAAFVMLWPSRTALLLIQWMSAWALLTGGLSLFAAKRLKKKAERGQVLFSLLGAASLVFGLGLWIIPAVAPEQALAWMAAYAFIAAGLWLALGVWLWMGARSARRGTGARVPATA